MDNITRWLVYVCLSLTVIVSCGPRASAADAKTGQFETTFAERSPLSSTSELTKRLALKDAGDYDLSGQSFIVYVPQNYDASIPHGLIVWLNYKDAENTPPKWQPILDKTHTIFVVTKTCGQADWIRAGLALDAVHNLRKLYSIDERRTYLFALLQPEQTIGQKMGLTYPDVFAGFVYIFNQRYFRPIPIPGSGGLRYEPSFTRPAANLFQQAKTRAHVIVADPKTSDAMRLVQKAYQDDGFRELLYIEATLDDLHYPNLTTPWFEKALAYLDAPPTQPATRPTLTDAQRLVNLAKTYISAGNYAPARVRLQDVVMKYPDDPAADEARQLLEQIKGK